MVTKISKWSRIQYSCQITLIIESLVVYAMPDIPSKFQKDPSITFWVILLTRRQTNKNRQKHYLLSGGNNTWVVAAFKEGICPMLMLICLKIFFLSKNFLLEIQKLGLKSPRHFRDMTVILGTDIILSQIYAVIWWKVSTSIDDDDEDDVIYCAVYVFVILAVTFFTALDYCNALVLDVMDMLWIMIMIKIHCLGKSNPPDIVQ